MATYLYKILLKICFSVLLLGLGVSIHAQKLSTSSKKAEGLYKKGLAYYQSQEYDLAKNPLKQAINKDNKFIEAYLLLSEVYFEQENYRDQVYYLEKVVELDSTFFVYSYYSLGLANFQLGEFDKSIQNFSAYLTKTNNVQSKQKADDWLTKAKFAKTAMSKPRHIVPINLGEKINSKNNEYWPSITADEQTMVYTVLVERDSILNKKPYANAMANHFHEDFFSSVKNAQGEWEERKQLDAPINSDSNEGAQTLSSDGNWMFFTACGRSDSKGSCDIYFSYRTATGWSSPKNIGSPVNSPFWESQPSFSSDGRTLYFSSNRSGGKGANDIWRATVMGIDASGTPIFGSPENLGNNINTASNEVSPFIHPDNSNLYFASEGWPGMGKADLFMSRMTNGVFVEPPVNLGFPINTAADEVGLVITANGRTAYFSSDGYEDSFGGRDIYSFDMPIEIRPLPVSYVKGRVYDSRTREKLKAAFELKDINSGKMIVEAMSTDFSGDFLVCLPMGAEYALNVSKKGYLFYSDFFKMDSLSSAADPQILDIYLKPLNVGEQIVLNNIFFEIDSYQLRPESEVELQKLLQFLNENSQIKIQLLGYTDNVGSPAYNQKLSMQRAQEVYHYLIKKGIPANRVSFKGEGMNDPIETNETETGRAKNRRTELKIIE